MMRQPLPTMAYRVEIVVCCPRGHKLLPFHRITVPDLEMASLVSVVSFTARLGRSRRHS